MLLPLSDWTARQLKLAEPCELTAIQELLTLKTWQMLTAWAVERHEYGIVGMTTASRASSGLACTDAHDEGNQRHLQCPASPAACEAMLSASCAKASPAISSTDLGMEVEETSRAGAACSENLRLVQTSTASARNCSAHCFSAGGTCRLEQLRKGHAQRVCQTSAKPFASYRYSQIFPWPWMSGCSLASPFPHTDRSNLSCCVCRSRGFIYKWHEEPCAAHSWHCSTDVCRDLQIRAEDVVHAACSRCSRLNASMLPHMHRAA